GDEVLVEERGVGRLRDRSARAAALVLRVRRPGLARAARIAAVVPRAAPRERALSVVAAAVALAVRVRLALLPGGAPGRVGVRPAAVDVGLVAVHHAVVRSRRLALAVLADAALAVAAGVAALAVRASRG